ncbi:hypothetical protein [Pantoea ananatis]|uniref:hypothetical protein n=1 Tax=Pantoea ananas TaxID=553 RepID=UPI0030186046
MFSLFNRKEEKSLLKLSDIKSENKDQRKLRQNHDMAVIDDEPFAQATNLKNAGFQIVEVGDISNLKIIESYPIIICDIQGVGKAFGSSVEGAYVISEIRKQYPDKYIIGYSTNSFNMGYQPYINKSDVSLLKVNTTEDWTQILDKAINIISDPKSRWIRMRKEILESGVELQDVLNLEQAYIKSVLEKDAQPLTEECRGTELDSRVKDLMSSFITTALAEIIKKTLE